MLFLRGFKEGTERVGEGVRGGWGKGRERLGGSPERDIGRGKPLPKGLGICPAALWAKVV